MNDQPKNALSIWQIVGRAHGLVLRNALPLLVAAGPAMLLMAAILFVHFHLPKMVFRIETICSVALFSIPMLLISWRWLHRALPSAVLSGVAQPSTQARLVRFACYGLPSTLTFLMLPVISVLLVFAGIEIAGMVSDGIQQPEAAPMTVILVLWPVLLVLWYLVAGRVLLVLPAIALHGEGSLRQTWHQTRGQGRRITAALAIVSLSAFLIGTAVYFLLLIGASVFAALWGPSGTTLAKSSAVAFAYPISLIFATTLGTALATGVLGLEYLQIHQLPGKASDEVLATFD